jgi:PAS domain S-box-containing protein
MRSLRHLPIRQRVSAITMLTTASALLVACGAYIVFDYISLRRTALNDLQMLASVVAAKSAAAVMFNDAEAGNEIISGVRARPSIVAGAIVDVHGHLFVSYGAWKSASQDERTVKVSQPIRYRNEPIGTLVLASDFREVRSGMRLKAMTGAAIVILALLVAALMTTRLQRLVSGPLLDLARAAQRVRRDKDFAIRVAGGPPVAGDELAAVQQAFNAMLEEIGARDEALRSYQVDLERQVLARTHELTTAVERNQAILDSAGEGIFGLDLSGIVTFMNPSAVRILGGQESSLVGRSLHASIHSTTCPDRPLPFHDCKVCGTSLKPAVRTGRGSFMSLEGASVPIEYTSSTIIDASGAATGVVVTFRDISERLAIERMKDEFVSTVSHELRTPLTAIRGAIGLLGTGLLGNPSPKGQRMLDIALANTERLGRLINDILDLEKMESGRVELNRKSIPIHDLLKQTAEAMQPMGDRAGVKIFVNAAPEHVLGDPDRIQQMVINLLSNAIKFSPSDTTVDLTGRLSDDTYIVAVRDEGRGIPEDKLETVFERFKQVDASDSRDKGGTGLGLAICRSIAEAHGGKIWARRGEPAGSVFTFTLPMPSSARRDEARRVIVLYEEDERAAASLVAPLEARGFTVRVASCERELTECAALGPEAILMDLHAASAGAALLQAIPDDVHAPVIVMSNEEPPSEMVARWVPKPARLEDVADAVMKACARVDVLVVEDDFDLARVLMAAMEESGIRAQHAATGKEAIDLLQERVPSLIVLDLMLPEINGFAVVDWIRQRPLLARTPLLVYSARETSAAEQERLTLGPTEFVTKSRVSIEEFEARVAHLLFGETKAA